jgi:hypothetical protein
MAAIAGFGGVVTLSGLTVGVKTWIINTVADALETTELADNQNRDFIAGLKTFSGSLEGNWDSGNTLAVGDSGAATFQVGASGALTYSAATILITSIDQEDAFDGVISAPVAFQGTGAQPVFSSSSSG